MRYMTGPIMAALALSACGGGVTDADADGDGKVSQAEARAAVAEARQDIKPEPGLYATTMALVKVDMPGAPPQVAQMMGSAMNREGEFCLTPEEAERGFEDTIRQGQNEACEISSFTIEGNQIDMKMACNQGALGQMDVAMSGEVSPTASDMTMTMSGSIPELGTVNMEMSFKQERVGDCEN